MPEKPKTETDSISTEWLRINEKMLKPFDQTPENQGYVKKLLNTPPDDLLAAIKKAHSFANHYKKKLKDMDSDELKGTFDLFRQKGHPIPEAPITNDEDRLRQINLVIDAMKKDPREIILPASISDDSEYTSDLGDVPYFWEPTE